MSLTLATFSLAAFVTVVTPGPTSLLALTNGSRFGMRLAGFGIAGAVLSDLVLIAAVSAGLGALLAASQFWFSLLKWLGVAYLCWLGIGMLWPRKAAGPTGAGNAELPSGPWPVFRRSFLTAVTNPKGYLFFTAFLPQFIELKAALPMQYVMLALIFAGIDLLVLLGFAAAGAFFGRRMAQQGKAGQGRWIEPLCGACFLALAGGLALMRRAAV
ncbi:MAG: LysE family translocator [Gemmobacter sp.]|uniref:LysE family translocator n=1 Tax=Gemmobacter sp. TaxID=1898957 RepID=UPI001A46B7F2|nr:LysE family translocator [Gemmobacter sp.]MBL8561540.1 LysE family translocator [Gemmobacter sp.]